MATKEGEQCCEEMTLQDFKMWSEEALKHFLYVRMKSVEGDLETLIYRAMSAYEEKIPIDEEAERKSRVLLAEYKRKLVVNGKSYPDPFSLDGWKGETKGTGLSKWPSVYYMDIERFLCRLNKSDDLLRRLSCDYKEGKSYRYYKCDFVKEIFYHNISEKDKYCYVRCRVTPSMRFSNAAYYVWALIEKDSDTPGGSIASAYCTCTAGLLGCCNHVIAMLFRIEAAVRTGVTKPSCTSLLSKWNVPKGTKTILEQKPVCELVFSKSSYASNDQTAIEMKAANEKYKTFVTCSSEQEELLKKPEHFRNYLYEELKSVVPNSCFVQMVKGKKNEEKIQTKESTAAGIKLMAQNFELDKKLISLTM